jgi:hypothetical protein
MAERRHLEFFLLRYVPDAVKDEFVNIGVVAVEAGGGFAEVRFTRDWRRVRCLDAGADVEMLEALGRDLQERIGDVGNRAALLEKLQDAFSNTIQLSPVKGCLTDDPAKEMDALAGLYLETRREAGKREASGRQRILGAMRGAFEQAGVWALMRKGIAAAQYTYKGDPLRIDCGYRPNGEVKLFQAVSLATDVDAAKVLAFSYPRIEAGIRRLENAATAMTAVVEDELDRTDEGVLFALATLQEGRIRVAGVGEMAGIAEVARREMRV